MGDLSKAVFDINALAKLIPDNTKAYFKMSELHYSMGEAELALNDVRECLRLDPDHKKCSESYKKLRKLNKLLEAMRKASEESNFDECVRSAQSVQAHDPKSASFKLKAASYLCSCNSRAKNAKQAIENCSEVLKINPNDADAFYHRGQAYIADEQLENGITQRTATALILVLFLKEFQNFLKNLIENQILIQKFYLLITLIFYTL